MTIWRSHWWCSTGCEGKKISNIIDKSLENNVLYAVCRPFST